MESLDYDFIEDERRIFTSGNVKNTFPWFPGVYRPEGNWFQGDIEHWNQTSDFNLVYNIARYRKDLSLLLVQ